MRSKRPNAAPNRSSPAVISSSDGPEGLRECGGADGVVDVVEPRQRQPDAGAAARRVELEGRAVEAVQLDLTRHDLQRRARVPARRAAVVAEMTDIGRGELVRATAADAVPRVRGVLERRPCLPRVVEPVGDGVLTDVRQVADLRVVPVHDQGRAGLEPGDGRAPALGHELELAVAVELVAKEIPEQERPRADAACDLRQRALVHLEQAELGVPGAEQGGGDARDQVGAGSVPGEPSRTQDLRHHRRRRRLAVRRRHERDAGGKPGREGVDRGGIELPEELPRQRRAAARTCELRQARSGSRGKRFHGKSRAHASPSLPRPADPPNG